MPSRGLLNDLVTFPSCRNFCAFLFCQHHTHSVGCLLPLASLLPDIYGTCLPSSFFNSAVSYSAQTLSGHEISFSRLETLLLSFTVASLVVKLISLSLSLWLTLLDRYDRWKQTAGHRDPQSHDQFLSLSLSRSGR